MLPSLEQRVDPFKHFEVLNEGIACPFSDYVATYNVESH